MITRYYSLVVEPRDINPISRLRIRLTLRARLHTLVVLQVVDS